MATPLPLPLHSMVIVLVVFLSSTRTAAELSGSSSSSNGGGGSSKCSREVVMGGGVKKSFERCLALPSQGASLAWTIHGNITSKKKKKSEEEVGTVVDMAFWGEAPSARGWVGWGINPGSRLEMVGTSAFIAFHAPNGTTLLPLKLTQAIKSRSSPPFCSSIELDVLHSALISSPLSPTMIILLSLHFPSSSSTSTGLLLNHVWARGERVNTHLFQPGPHGLAPSDLHGLLTIDMISGSPSNSPPTRVVLVPSSPHSYHHRLKNVHGVLSSVGWSLVMGIGMMSARYLRPFTHSAWLYAHLFCQCLGFLLGAAGFIAGLQLRYLSTDSRTATSVSASTRQHRSVGFAIFALGASQMVSALLARPHNDHPARPCWNVLHRGLAYSIVALSILNSLDGLRILSPPLKWVFAYIASASALGLLALVLELALCFAMKRTRDHEDQLMSENPQLNKWPCNNVSPPIVI